MRVILLFSVLMVLDFSGRWAASSYGTDLVEMSDAFWDVLKVLFVYGFVMDVVELFRKD